MASCPNCQGRGQVIIGEEWIYDKTCRFCGKSDVRELLKKSPLLARNYGCSPGYSHEYTRRVEKKQTCPTCKGDGTMPDYPQLVTCPRCCFQVPAQARVCGYCGFEPSKWARTECHRCSGKGWYTAPTVVRVAEGPRMSPFIPERNVSCPDCECTGKVRRNVRCTMAENDPTAA